MNALATDATLTDEQRETISKELNGKVLPKRPVNIRHQKVAFRGSPCLLFPGLLALHGEPFATLEELATLNAVNEKCSVLRACIRQHGADAANKAFHAQRPEAASIAASEPHKLGEFNVKSREALEEEYLFRRQTAKAEIKKAVAEALPTMQAIIERFAAFAESEADQCEAEHLRSLALYGIEVSRTDPPFLPLLLRKAADEARQRTLAVGCIPLEILQGIVELNA